MKRFAPIKPQHLDILPDRMKKLGVDERGYIVPWFVDWVDGKPVFQAYDPLKYKIAIEENRCWLSGDKLGAYKTFVVGPMCGINRTSAEPPSHHDCATFAAKACPFLTTPHAVRRQGPLQGQDIKSPGGHPIKRNPGVTLLWTTKSYQVQKVDNGYIIRMGRPTNIEFWAKGTPAKLAQVEDSVRTGLPVLHDAARVEGREALQLLQRMAATFNDRVHAVLGERLPTLNAYCARVFL
ncbi:MAG: hypothetical protein GDA50_04095 [Alphaproteobacteria bacterium GM202ARS2]|nr:hypothetical protein [Alphaproteobacteria bacterium GM202ARS2]